MNKKNILILVGDLDPGGAENVVVSLARMIDASSTFRAVICSRKTGSLMQRLEGISVFIEPKHKESVFDFAHLHKLIQLVRRENIKLIHSHLFGNDLYATLASVLTGVPAILTIHGKECFETLSRRIFYCIASHLVSRVVTVSASLRNRLLSERLAAKKKVAFIANGIDIRPFQKEVDATAKRRELSLPRTSPIVGCVGNLKPVKGYDILLHAAATILRAQPETCFVIVGEAYQFSWYLDDLQGLVKTLGIEGHVRFLGKRDDVHEILPVFDVYVLPSRSEGQSIALIEAMASARAIVATHVGGTPELLTDGITGLLVLPEDSASLAKAITFLIEDQIFARKLAAQARCAADNYSASNMAAQYMQLYTEVLSC